MTPTRLRIRPTSIRCLVFALACALLATACGQKGPLYLADPAAERTSGTGTPAGTGAPARPADKK